MDPTAEDQAPTAPRKRMTKAARTRLAAVLAGVLALGVFVAFNLLTSGGGVPGYTVASLLKDAKPGERARVSGVIEDALVSPTAGTLLILHDKADTSSTVAVFLKSGQQRSSEALVGHETYVTGTWDGELLRGTEIITKDLVLP